MLCSVDYTVNLANARVNHSAQSAFWRWHFLDGALYLSGEVKCQHLVFELALANLQWNLLSGLQLGINWYTSTWYFLGCDFQTGTVTRM